VHVSNRTVRWIVVLASSLGLLGIQTTGSVAATTRARAMATAINVARERHGRRPLRISTRVASVPRRHSTRMARTGGLFHSCLSCLLRRFGWRRVGENVGFSATIRGMSRAFMRSPPHRENVLCRCFTRVAVGVVRSGGRLWVTELFYRP
jgi:uncharacterized protein YkwD